MEKKSKLTAYLCAITAVTLWGLSFVWTNKILLNNVPVFTFLFIRILIAGTLLLIFSKATKQLMKVSKKDFLYMFLMAFFEPFIYFLGESYGMQYTGSAVIASVVIAIIPITCLITERVLYKSPFSLNKLVGIILTIIGVICVVFKGEDFNVDNIYGILLLFVAVGAATGFSTVVRKLSAKYNNFTITTYQFTLGALLFFPFFLAYGVDGVNEDFFKRDIIEPLLLLAIFCSCVAFAIWVIALRELGIARANVFSALMPGISAIAAALMGQEVLTLLSIIGTIIVIIGVIIAQKENSK